MIVFFPSHLQFPTGTAGVLPQYLLVICVQLIPLLFQKLNLMWKTWKGKLCGGQSLVFYSTNSDPFRKACWRSQESRSFQLPVLGIQSTKKSNLPLRWIPVQSRGSSAHLQLCPHRGEQQMTLLIYFRFAPASSGPQPQNLGLVRKAVIWAQEAVHRQRINCI